MAEDIRPFFWFGMMRVAKRADPSIVDDLSFVRLVVYHICFGFRCKDLPFRQFVIRRTCCFDSVHDLQRKR